MYSQIEEAVRHRFGVPFAGVKFALDLDRRLVVVEAIRQDAFWVLKTGGRFVLYKGEIDGPVYPHRVFPHPTFDAWHLAERCQAITALLGLTVEIRDYKLSTPQDC